MTRTRLGACLAALVAALLGATARIPEQPSPKSGDAPRFRLTTGSEAQLDDLRVEDAAAIDDQTLVLVGTKAGAEDADPNHLGPNGVILDLATKKARPFTNGHAARICSVAVRRGQIATASLYRDPLVRVWDVKAGKTVRQINIDKALEGGGYTREDPSENTEQAVAWFHKSDTLAVASDEHVVLLDPDRPAKPVAVLPLPLPWRAKTWVAGPLAVSPDDARVASPLGQGPYGTPQVICWDVKTAKATVVSLAPKGVKKPHSWRLRGVAFSPAGQLIAWRHNIPDVEPGTAKADAVAATRPVGRVELTGPAAGTYEPLPVAEGMTVLSCAIDPTGQWLAVAGSDPTDNQVRVYHLPSGKLACRERLTGEQGPMWVAFTPSGKRLACATYYGLVRWWEVAR